MNKSDAEVLSKVRDYLSDEDHWYKGDYNRYEPDEGADGHDKFKITGHCLVGTVMALAHIRSSATSFLCQPFHDVIWEQFRDRVEPIGCAEGEIHATVTMFNDHPDTTHDEIMLVVEKAAVRADEVVGE